MMKYVLIVSVMLLFGCTKKSSADRVEHVVETACTISDKVLYGSWFTPHLASIKNITFYEDNTFTMNDYMNMDSTFCMLTRKGSYSCHGEAIILKCNNGEERTLKTIEIEDRIYLCDNKAMMIKGS